MSKFKATTETRGAERRFNAVANEMERELRDLVEEVGDDAEIIFAAHALKKTGRMSRGVRSIPRGTTATVQVHAKDPNSGFDYVAVTRFGHRKAFIEPKHAVRNPGRYIAPIPGVGPRWVSKRAALKTPFGFFARVRGFKPKSDWAQAAIPEVQRNAQQTISRLGLKITARLSS